VVYTFKITARNVVGFGADSSEVAIRAASIPNAPAAPTTTINKDESVTISWDAPQNGGSEITSYTVKVQQSDGSTYSTESENCNMQAGGLLTV